MIEGSTIVAVLLLQILSQSHNDISLERGQYLMYQHRSSVQLGSTELPFIEIWISSSSRLFPDLHLTFISLPQWQSMILRHFRSTLPPCEQVHSNNYRDNYKKSCYGEKFTAIGEPLLPFNFNGGVLWVWKDATGWHFDELLEFSARWPLSVTNWLC
jgi:hypothetical protein